MWGIFGSAYRGRNKIVAPLNEKLEYAVLLNRVPDYIAGHAVSKVGTLAEDCTSVILPKGKYVKDTCSAETFETLVDEVLPKRSIKPWAKENGVELDGRFSAEVYPREEFEKGHFEMYTLTPVKE